MTDHDPNSTNGEKKEVTTELLIKLHKGNILRKIKEGETGLTKELDYLLQLEERLKKEGSNNSRRDTVHRVPTGDSNGLDDSNQKSVGIPDHLRIKRHYTITDAVRKQRSEAGKARAKKCMSPNWKHGKYSKSFVMGAIKPCKSTCPEYPCKIVEDGGTEPGSACLDKAAVIDTFRAIDKALKEKQFDDFNEIASLNIAKAIQTTTMLLDDIIRDGTLHKREKYGTDGQVIGYEIVLHPSLLALPKLLADLCITPQEFMLTPRQIIKQGAEDKGIQTIADLMSRVGNTMKQHKAKGQPGNDHDEDE